MHSLTQMVLLATCSLALLGAGQEGILPRGVRLPATKDVSGKPAPVPSAKKVTVVVFATTECPIAAKIAPELKRVIGVFKARDVAFRIVYVDRESSAGAIRKHAAERHLDAQLVWDKEGAIAKALGARITPEAVVLNSKGTVLYRGRIDDRFIDHGRERAVPTRKDLEIAISEVLASKRVSVPSTEAVGCAIVH